MASASRIVKPDHHKDLGHAQPEVMGPPDARAAYAWREWVRKELRRFYAQGERIADEALRRWAGI